MSIKELNLKVITDSASVYKAAKLINPEQKLNYNAFFSFFEEVLLRCYVSPLEGYTDHLPKPRVEGKLLLTMDTRNRQQESFATAIDLSTPWEVQRIEFSKTFTGYANAQSRAPWIWEEISKSKESRPLHLGGFEYKPLAVVSNEPLVVTKLEEIAFNGGSPILAFFKDHMSSRLLDSELFYEVDFTNPNRHSSGRPDPLVSGKINFIDISKSSWMETLFSFEAEKVRAF